MLEVDDRTFCSGNDFLIAYSREQFPVKLYAMLQLADTQGIGRTALGWLPHGRAFRILDVKTFMEVVVPVFYKQTKIRSFYRQLNLWGFKRVSKGIDAGAWYHAHFLRGARAEMSKMIRIKIKGKSKNPDMLKLQKDPDFYSMPPQPEFSKSSSSLFRRFAKSTVRGGLSSLTRRVSMDFIANGSASDEFLRQGTAFRHSEEHGLPMAMPETTLSRSVSPQPLVTSSNHIITQPVMPTSMQTIVWNNEFTGAPSTAHMDPYQQHPLMHKFHESSSPIQQPCKLISPVSSTMFPDDDENRRTMLMAELKTLPFNNEGGRSSSSTFPAAKVIRHRSAGEMEPLPFNNEPNPNPEFAKYIGTVLQEL